MINFAGKSSFDVKREPVRYYPVKAPWRGKDVPNVTIEVNDCCNISCYGCYKGKNKYQKSLELIKQEIDFAVSQRRLSSLAIMGGEPTMHPELTEVIRYIRQKGIRPMFLTNGTLLTPEKLRGYKEAGISRICIHVDSHQNKRPDTKGAKTEKELNYLRDKYVDMCSDAGIRVGLAITVYRDTLDQLTDILDYSLAKPAITAILFTNYSHRLNLNENTSEDGLSVRNVDVYRVMEKIEQCYPSFYLPSSHNEFALRWLIYSAFVTRDKNDNLTKYYLHPENKLLLKLLPRLGKIIQGKYIFDQVLGSRELVTMLMLVTLLSFKPATILKTTRFLSKCLVNRNIKALDFIFQEPPSLNADGEIETCLDCPDATVRNGELVPICIADKVAPRKEFEERKASGISL